MTSAWTEGLGGVLDQNSVRNGIDSGVPKDTVPLPLVSNNAEDSLANNKVKTTPVGRSLADPKRCHCVAIIFEEDEKRRTYVVTSRMGEFQNDHHLKILGL